MRHRKRNNSRQQPVELEVMCAVETCGCGGAQKHHYIPWRFLPENTFTLRLCPDHHDMVDKLLASIDICTPLEFFKIMFEFIYGKGAAYRRLEVHKDTIHIPRVSVHYASGRRYGDD